MMNNKKKSVVSSGGLGDAVLIFARLQQLYGNDYTLTHVMIKQKLLGVVQEFYNSQGISADVKKIDDWGWLKNNKMNYDYHAKIIDSPDWDQISPSPKYILNNSNENFDIVISPTAGRDNDRCFKLNELRTFCEKNNRIRIVLVGQTNNIYDGLNVVNLINKTTIQETLDIIAGCSIVIAPAGFISIIGASMNKMVYTKKHHNNDLIKRTYYHPKWIKNNFINTLNEVML